MKEKLKEISVKIKPNPILWALTLYILYPCILKPLIEEISDRMGLYRSYPDIIFFIILSFVSLYLFEKYYSPHYKGGSLKINNIFKGLLMLLSTFLAATFMDWYVFGQIGRIPFDFHEFFAGFKPGISEEAFSRGLIIPVIYYTCKKHKIMKAAFVSSVLFGLWHISNFIHGYFGIRDGRRNKKPKL